MIRRAAEFVVATCLCVLAVTAAATANPPLAAAADNHLFNDAQAAFSRGDAAQGLGKLNELLRGNPDDRDAQALRAIWADYAGDHIAKFDAINRVGARRGDVDSILRNIASASLVPPNPFPSLQGPQTAIIILGYGLLPDGAMRPELVNRLASAYVQAIAAPMSPIVVTGGNPQNGITEAAAMEGWLRANGIPANRIHADHRAGSTVGNALYSTEILRSIGAANAVIVTSADHVRRAMSDFNIAGTPIIGAMATPGQVLSNLMPATRAQQRGMYVDATRIIGIPATR